jgi:hypothetical protein
MNLRLHIAPEDIGDVPRSGKAAPIFRTRMAFDMHQTGNAALV